MIVGNDLCVVSPLLVWGRIGRVMLSLRLGRLRFSHDATTETPSLSLLGIRLGFCFFMCVPHLVEELYLSLLQNLCRQHRY